MHTSGPSTTRLVRRAPLFSILFVVIVSRFLILFHAVPISTVVLSASLPSTSTTGKGRKNAHTSLSGFGSRSSRKSIFANQPKGLVTSSSELDSDATVLWVQRTLSNGHHPVLRFRCLDRVTLQNTTLQVALDHRGEWRAECIQESNETMTTRNIHTVDDTSEWIPIRGIYGVYSVPSGMIWVLIVATEPSYENTACNWNVHRVQGLELVHIGHDARAASSSAALHQRTIKEEARQIRLLRHALRHHEFYLIARGEGGGAVRDMTHSWQRALEFASNQGTLYPLDEWWYANTTYRPDERFFWNQASVEPILQRYQTDASETSVYETLLRHVVPVTSMFVGVAQNVTVANMTYDQVLLSRRSRFRAGTRFTKRGADALGHVANYAETEQVLWLETCLSGRDASKISKRNDTATSGVLMSHVQTRGSIPLRWSSPADVKTYRPRVRIGTDPLAQGRAVRSHVRRECDLYAKYDFERPTEQAQLVFLNLIDKKKDQERLGKTFDAVLQAVLDVYTVSNRISTSTENANADSVWRLAPNMVKHVWFDFHAEVKNGRWDRLGSLMKDQMPALEEQGFLCAIPGRTWTVVSKQRGIVRTNCMDCLDRTNVVQSLFGRFMLHRSLSECGHYVSGSKRSLAKEHSIAFRRNPLSLPWSEGEVAHRFLWADNADAISRLYAGTPALKGDFTRTGKRTKRGALDDGMNSLQRYYLNNFLDADRQEGMDLMVGHAMFSTDETSRSMEETTRAILLGEVAAERHDAPLRSPQEILAKRLRPKGGGASILSRSKRLDLRWLPGDLQSHMKSHASSVLAEAQQALESMDRRAASDIPWWVAAEDDRSSETEGEDEDSDVSARPWAASTNTGYIIGCLVAAIQAPTTTAASLVFLLGLAGAKRRGDEAE